MAVIWAVDDKPTYLLMVRFAQEWPPRADWELPAHALAYTRRWPRSVTNRDCRSGRRRCALFRLLLKCSLALYGDTDDVISSTVSFACAAWWDATVASAHDVAQGDLQPQ